MSKFKKFLFFLASLIPGAGHMFLGFMKRGLLLMTIYFIDIGLSMILNGFLVFMPVIWFYCFFDAWNKFELSQDQKKLVDDSFIFFYNAIPEELLPKSQRFQNKIPQKIYKYLGTALAFFGIVMLCRELRENLDLPKYVEQILSFMPELLISLALILIGIRLIAHKKKEIFDSDEQQYPNPNSEIKIDVPTISNIEIESNDSKTDDLNFDTESLSDSDEIKFEPIINSYVSSDEEKEDANENKEIDTAQINACEESSISSEPLSEINNSSSKDNQKLESSNSPEAQKIDLASQSILDEIDASLSPIFDKIEKDSGAKDVEYIWSSPVKTDDNPQ